MNDDTPKDEPAPTPESLEDKLKRHHEWLKLSPEDQEIQKDQRLVLHYQDLSNWNLSAIDLRKADLTGSILIGAQFEKARLEGTNLSQVDFTGIDFKDADLSHANLRDAILVQTVFKHANTDGTHFGGSNMSHAKMYSDNYFDDRIVNVNESTKIVRTLFITLLGALAFCGLTILSTQDSQLLNFATSFKLPIIGTDVSIKWFYYLAPWFLLGLFVYFHLYLIKHCWLLAKQPRILPDNSSLGDKILPWVLNSWAIHYFEDSKGEREGIQWSREVFSFWLAWFVTPICLMFFWIRSFVSQNEWLTETHFWAVVISLALAWGYGQIARNTLATRGWGMEQTPTWEHILHSVELVILYVLLAWLGSGKELTPNFISEYFQRPDIAYQELSIKPENWDPKDPTAGVRGADLSNKDLSYAKASNAFLVNANLRRADFKGADLRGADLRRANLSMANFGPTIPYSVSLEIIRDGLFAFNSLRGSHGINDFIVPIETANLTGADLRKADLTRVNFSKVFISGADLTGANLFSADLREARQLEPNQVKKAKNWDAAFYRNEFRKKLGITDNRMWILRLVYEENLYGISAEAKKRKVQEFLGYYELKYMQNQ